MTDSVELDIRTKVVEPSMALPNAPMPMPEQRLERAPLSHSVGYVLNWLLGAGNRAP